MLNHISDIWYRIKCYFWHRYTTIKPRHLPHTWVDRCELLPHTMFEILSDFIENELESECLVDEQVMVAGQKVNFKEEILDLYNWWHKDYLVNFGRIYDDFHKHASEHMSHKFEESEGCDLEWITNYTNDTEKVKSESLWKEARDREVAYGKELTRRMHRLVDISQHLWT